MAEFKDVVKTERNQSSVSLDLGFDNSKDNKPLSKDDYIPVTIYCSDVTAHNNHHSDSHIKSRDLLKWSDIIELASWIAYNTSEEFINTLNETSKESYKLTDKEYYGSDTYIKFIYEHSKSDDSDSFNFTKLNIDISSRNFKKHQNPIATNIYCSLDPKQTQKFINYLKDVADEYESLVETNVSIDDTVKGEDKSACFDDSNIATKKEITLFKDNSVNILRDCYDIDTTIHNWYNAYQLYCHSYISDIIIEDWVSAGDDIVIIKDNELIESKAEQDGFALVCKKCNAPFDLNHSNSDYSFTTFVLEMTFNDDKGVSHTSIYNIYIYEHNNVITVTFSSDRIRCIRLNTMLFKMWGKVVKRYDV